ncbi:MAG: TetR/AcrR family transcriptional regulator [Candidatus Marinimicrobia bacterium]|nr:TetR/AcrR family transcriptional regulator [Candidatus Neomarinimicrobiota bacterium]MBL7022470.1 TetR/AcrR family transcriptional regulator [Candidatus Neomarinimicrobiota bacterium]MBL7108675.1 TetR/AcrR family transcriptional regulator [Candidatus Neomarinimicrobiota bacterium]
MARPKKSERNADNEIKKLILASAEQLFAEKGFSATTTRDIAGEININKNLIYYYFTNKTGLYRAVIEQNAGPIFETIIKAISENLSINELIDVIVDSYFSVLIKKRDIFPRLIAREQANGGQIISEIISERITPLLSKLNKYQNQSSKINIIQYSMIIGTIIFPFMTSNIWGNVAEITGEKLPTMKELKSQVKNYIKHGVSND